MEVYMYKQMHSEKITNLVKAMLKLRLTLKVIVPVWVWTSNFTYSVKWTKMASLIVLSKTTL